MNTRPRTRSLAPWGAPAALWLATAVALPAQVAAPTEFTRIECHRSDALVVQLRVQQQATPADRDWLLFEFDNRTGTNLAVAGISYRLDRAQVFDALTGELRQQQQQQQQQQQSLGSGHDFDLGLRRDGELGVQLPPGCTRVAAPVSDYATALLGMPPTTGWRVDAELSFLLDGVVVGGGGKAISFRWSPPDAVGLARMRVTLTELLAVERPPIGSLYLAGMLLELPEVGGRCSVPDLLAVQARARGPFAPWAMVRRHLSAHRPTAADLIAWIRARLYADDPTVAEDLHHMPKVWHASFLEPLLTRYEAGEALVPMLLEQRDFPQRGDAVAERRLSAPLLKELGEPTAARVALFARDEESRLRQQLSGVIQDLGRTCDAAAIEALVRWLGCTLVIQRDPFGTEPDTTPMRFCDVAYLAIQQLRGKQPWREPPEAGEPGSATAEPRRTRRAARLDQAPTLARRDRCIAALQQELAAGK